MFEQLVFSFYPLPTAAAPLSIGDQQCAKEAAADRKRKICIGELLLVLLVKLLRPLHLSHRTPLTYFIIDSAPKSSLIRIKYLLIKWPVQTYIMEPYQLVGDWVCPDVAFKVDVVPCAQVVVVIIVVTTRWPPILASSQPSMLGKTSASSLSPSSKTCSQVVRVQGGAQSQGDLGLVCEYILSIFVCKYLQNLSAKWEKCQYFWLKVALACL